MRRSNNSRFGLEFRRSVNRMTEMITQVMERQNHEMTTKIFGDDDVGPNADLEANELLSSKDIYLKLGQQVELISLYNEINTNLMLEDRHLSRVFTRAANALKGIQDCMQKITVQLMFQHPWFPPSQEFTYYDFFNKFNIESEKKEQGLNLKKFFMSYKPPLFPKTQANQASLHQLRMHSQDFGDAINQSMGGKCCCSCADILFGRLDQARLILKKTFEGKQYYVKGPDGNTIDCMFFPCTSNENVLLAEKSGKICEDREYQNKPTVIMCNPNALVYQQMIIAPNAYWLNFFLKREINVIAWNYRGYGESEIGWFDYLTPAKSKCDSERVLANSIQQLKLQGKIGVFGRSIGGITACHLAGKYNDLVELLVIDRSMDELTGIAEQKLRGTAISSTYNLLYRGLICQNAEMYVKANSCYKIITDDPLDDTVGPFESTMAGVASQVAKHQYTSKEWKLFFESLLYLLQLEDKKFREYNFDIGEYEEEMLAVTQDIEIEMKTREQGRASINSVEDNDDSIIGSQKTIATRPISESFLSNQKLIGNNSHGEFFRVLLMLSMMVSDLQAATVKMSDVLGVSAKPSFKEFICFLKLAEVYGGGYLDDVDFHKFGNRQKQTHKEALIVELERILEAYEIAIVALDMQKQDNPVGKLQTYHDEFTRHIIFQQSMFRRMIEIQRSSEEDLRNDFFFSPEGHLVQFACGHRGQPSRIEEKRVSRLMRKSGFIPELEALPWPNKDKKSQESSTNQLGKSKPMSDKPKQPAQNIAIVGSQPGSSPPNPDNLNHPVIAMSLPSSQLGLSPSMFKHNSMLGGSAIRDSKYMGDSMIVHEVSKMDITMYKSGKVAGDQEIESDGSDNNEESKLILEEVEENEESPSRSMSLESMEQDRNELKKSKRNASIMPLLHQDDSMFVGIVTPSRKTVTGTPPSTNSSFLVGQVNPKVFGGSQSVIEKTNLDKATKQNKGPEEDPYSFPIELKK